MMNVISSEIYKILRSKIFYAVVIIFSFISIFAFISCLKEKLSTASPEILQTGISAFKGLYEADGIIYIILIFVSFLITSEYANGSIRQMSCRGIPRWQLVVGQYIAMSLIMTIVIIGFGFINLLTYTILFTLGEIDIMSFIIMNLGLISMIWSVTGIGSFLSYLFKNVGITIIASIILVVGNNFVLTHSITGMREVIVNTASNQQDVINCSIIFFVIAVITVLVSSILFTKRDVD